MADRYVKLDDVISIIKDVNWNLGGLIQHLKEHCPTADVVPKSEVARLQEDVDRLQDINNRQVENIKLAKQEVAKQIFEEIELKLSENDSFEITSDGKGLDYFDAKLAEEIAELKKKYTEGEPNGQDIKE